MSSRTVSACPSCAFIALPRQDYGAILLLDPRFRAHGASKGLSKWVRGSILHYDNQHHQLADDLGTFFERVREQFPTPVPRTPEPRRAPRALGPSATSARSTRKTQMVDQQSLTQLLDDRSSSVVKRPRGLQTRTLNIRPDKSQNVNPLKQTLASKIRPIERKHTPKIHPAKRKDRNAKAKNVNPVKQTPATKVRPIERKHTPKIHPAKRKNRNAKKKTRTRKKKKRRKKSKESAAAAASKRSRKVTRVFAVRYPRDL